MNQRKVPLYSLLEAFQSHDPISLHVPGHKNGKVFLENGKDFYDGILKLDMTELPKLDDLHAPTGVIKEAEQLAAQYFKADHTFFLVNGSTSGNLAMILATLNAGDKVLVQRNCHKSIMHGLELSGAVPIFLAPQYDEEVRRFTSPIFTTVQTALEIHPDVKAVILTYPDYFGRTFDIARMIELIHEYNIPVLVDEAHGVHFSLGSPFPKSSLELGADVVVQSAHKTAPAMTQSSYLHIKSKFLLKDRVAYYLQMVQSSSPSYPLMASLDLARSFLATRTNDDLQEIENSIVRLREIVQNCKCWDVLPVTKRDDPLKITLHVKEGYPIQKILSILEELSIYVELHTESQILLVHGLAPIPNNYLERLETAMERINEQLKKEEIHATIDMSKLFVNPYTTLALTYQDMNQLTYMKVPLEKGVGKIAAESIIPYPPGIPLILKGERITESQLETVNYLLEQGVNIQQRVRGINVFSNG